MGTKNMGTRVNASHRRQPENRMEPVGLPVNKICPACGLEKKPGSSHPKCSKKLQQMYFAGQLPKRKL